MNLMMGSVMCARGINVDYVRLQPNFVTLYQEGKVTICPETGCPSPDTGSVVAYYNITDNVCHVETKVKTKSGATIHTSSIDSTITYKEAKAKAKEIAKWVRDDFIIKTVREELPKKSSGPWTKIKNALLKSKPNDEVLVLENQL